MTTRVRRDRSAFRLRPRLRWALPAIAWMAAIGAAHASEIVVYPAAQIVTMDPAYPEARAIAVRDGRILALGELDDVVAALDTMPHRVDRRFARQVILPGFIDNHLHPLLGALLLPMAFITPEPWSLPDGEVEGVDGREAYLSRLRAAEAALPDGAWLDTWGHHALFHGPITRADLDAISSTRPIVVWQRSFHETVLNTRALEAAGIAEADVAGHPHIDFAKGHFFETGNAVVIRVMAPRLLAPERLALGLQMLRRLAHAGGITTMADMATGLMSGTVAGDLSMIRSGLDNEQTPFRVWLVPAPTVLAAGTADPAAAAEALAALPPTGSQRVRHLRGHVKFLADGAFFSQLMKMGAPGYLDGHHGEWITEPEVLAKWVGTFWDEGYALHVHANGDAGIDATLDILATLQARRPRPEPRFTLHHFGYSTTEQAARVAALGADVSANPNYVHVLADRYARHGLGPSRAATMVKLGGLVRAGVGVSLHSDLTMAPASPLFLAWVAAARESMSGRVQAPAERLTRMQALRAITIDAARPLGLAHEIGSLRPGKRADFTVLDRNPLETRVSRWRAMRVDATVFEGTVYPVE